MTQIEKYKSFIESLPAGSLSKEQLFVKDLLIQEEHDMSIYYVPYEYVNSAAKVMIIGITPGFTQMELALRSAREDLVNGVSYELIDQRAKKLASFAGSMRKNLIEMLDQIGLPAALGIKSSELLFYELRELLHTTSVIRYPVFIKGKNYTGHSPVILKSETLYHYAESIFLPELLAVKDALVLPLGKSVSDVVQHFANKGWIDKERCVFEMPHPSGANGHRKSQFEQSKTGMQQQVLEWFSHK
ncbi:uracil-DNA glycosylase family protein [Bacillus sp. FJAT-28004]|uniref:uracil-DNA glycosylase family protein n=1 Tax=Bacillus sp. FJAT-28004 TaxID=1679165 RepID=UPI0006B5570C|nr:uracil-DNA glycosylase family protein [Bacillus sp. FJAT-28004]